MDIVEWKMEEIERGSCLLGSIDIEWWVGRWKGDRNGAKY
jgi:hypothetical protein